MVRIHAHKQKLVIIGKQGVGKTTLVKRILGLLPRDLSHSGFLMPLDKTRSKRIRGLKFTVIENGRKEVEIPIARLKEGKKPSKKIPITLDDYDLELTLMKSLALDVLTKNHEADHLVVVDEWGPVLDDPTLIEVKNAIRRMLQDDETFLLLTVDNTHREEITSLLDSTKCTIFNLTRNNRDKIREKLLMSLMAYHSQFKATALESWKARLVTWFDMSHHDSSKVLLSMPKLVLQGPPRVGKTTIIEKFIRQFMENLKIRGFYTKELRDVTKKRIGFEARLLDGRKGVLAHVGITGPKVARYGVDLAVINDLLLPALEPPYHRDELIIIDEIGKMELMSPLFQEQIIKILDHPDAFVLATMRDPPTSFMQRLLRNQNVIVIPVTPSNRDDLPKELGHHVSLLLDQLTRVS